MRRILPLLFLFSCYPDAPHDNPYDPYNPDAWGGVRGSVFSKVKPLKGARVIAEIKEGIEKKEATTDSAGRFQLDSLPRGRILLYSVRSGYASESALVYIEPFSYQEKDFILNAIPQVISFGAWVENLIWYDEEIKEVRIRATVVDSDLVPEDVEDARVFLPDTSLTLELLYPENPYTGIYGLDITFIPPDSLLGKEVRIKVEDGEGERVELTERIDDEIPPVPSTVSPPDGEDLYFPFEFIWRKIDGYYYELVIWERGFYEKPVVDVTEIPSNETTYTITSLPSGYYEWTVFAVSSGGNRSGRVGWFRVP